MAHDVFISHSTQDKAVADAACATLEARNIRCWIAPRDILPGVDWGEAIVDAISGAKVMVLIFSNHSNTSDQVKREVQNAVGEGVAILPFRIADVTPIKSLRYFLGTQHWLDALTTPLERHLDRLADTVSALLARMADNRVPEPEFKPANATRRTSTTPAPQLDSGELANRLTKLREIAEHQRAEAKGVEEAEQRRRDDEFATLSRLLVEQLDAKAYQDARKTVTELLERRPDDSHAREAQGLIVHHLAAIGGDNSLLILPGGVIMEFVQIVPGTFMMGSPGSEPYRMYDELQHAVTLTKDFWLGKYPVTQAQWQAVIGSNPSHFQGDAQRPVDTVSWNDCQLFLQRLAAQGQGEFRLPTEAEWEYACRAGSTKAFCFGDDDSQLAGYAWYRANSGNRTHPVGQKSPNAWGLYDMHGNLSEWCQDWYGTYSHDAVIDPMGASSGLFRVTRGGTFGDDSRFCRAASRCWVSPDSANNVCLGFRILRIPS